MRSFDEVTAVHLVEHSMLMVSAEDRY